MPDTTAKTRLKMMTAWDVEPTLSEQEIDALLTQFAIADSDGYVSGDLAWVPSYNFRAAAKAGWEVKMGRASSLISSDLDGDRMSANQVFEHCERMVKKYSGTPTMNTGSGKWKTENGQLEEAFFEV